MGSADGAVTSMSVYVDQISSAPNNQFEVGIYTDSANKPGTLVAKSVTGTLTANSWNTVAITADLTANDSYWLMYNTNGAAGNRNNMRYGGGGTSTFSSSSTPFGTWPTTFASATNGGANFSIYATFTTDDPPPPPPLSNSGPGGPVLVIGSSANLFTTYYTEILKAEGINYYRLMDIANVSASTLTSYDVVILGEMPLTDPQVSMLSTWVDGGGNLIAMRPDKKLAPLLGLTAGTDTLAEAYLQIGNSGPGAGIVNSPMQYHGTADRYTLNGASAVATLYSNPTTATSNPAVSLRSVGSQGGQAAAFTFDLARSIVLTRQGNVAWSGEERDGVDGYQAHEMFIGGPSGVPDWNTVEQRLIPIADEQQRLLANMILQMNADNKPLPRFWYFPRDEKAVIIMTGDDHAANGATAARFEQYLAYSPANCDVDEWECIRSSSYVYTDTPLTNAQAVSYHNQGFEVGLHPNTNCRPWGSPSALDTIYENQLATWKAKYSGIPDPDSSRTHCVEWDDWATNAKTKLAHGIRLDTDYYYYPTTWVQDRPGYFNGTAQIMRFADLDGKLIDVWQATTQMTDESGQSYPYTVNTLLDKALGPDGFYSALTANMHTDSATSPESNAVVQAALARGVPVVSGRQMLTWLDDRDSSAFQSFNWNGSALSFTVTGGANGLRGMIPLTSTAGTLTSITRGGSPVSFTTQTIKGIQYAFFTATPGSYVGTYTTGDSARPTVISTTPTDGATGASASDPITVRFSEPMAAGTINTTNVELRTSGGALVGRTVTYDAGTESAVITPSAALTAGTGYTVTVKGNPGVTDVAGNSLLSDHSFSFTTAGASSSLLGFDQIGAQVDSGSQNHMNGSRFTTGSAPQTVNTMAVYMTSVQASANQFQLAIYTDNNGRPDALVASSTSGTLVANSWNTRPVSATLAANTPYWLMYNTNGDNNMSYDVSSNGSGIWSSSTQTFGSWPSNYGNSTQSIAKYSIYAFDASGVDLPPTVQSSTPAHGSTTASTTGPITVTFSEPMAAATINTTNVELRTSGDTLVNRTVTYDAGTSSAVITPSAALSAGATYTVIVKGNPGVTDTAGNTMAANHTFSFTTDNPSGPLLGHNQIGVQVDSGSQNHMNGSKFVTGSTPMPITSMSVYMTSVQASANQFQLAIYTDNNGSPDTLVASSASGTLTPNSWNSRPVTTTLAANTAYWLMYNTNGDNNMSYDTGTTGQGAWSSAHVQFGAWPNTYGNSNKTTAKFSIYAS
ncbi:Ig-like domain-containing protein [Phytohabitans kaempferiae]|uniref:Ig-like domain-containing protein n=1 Tax=Phytohabitans kaempferiae TaxID=1620943 RepID=A0ABV6MBU1_9ACTN